MSPRPGSLSPPSCSTVTTYRMFGFKPGGSSGRRTSPSKSAQNLFTIGWSSRPRLRWPRFALIGNFILSCCPAKVQGIPRRLPTAGGGVAEGGEENHALAAGVGGEELGHVVVEEGQAGGPEPLGVGRQVHLAAQDGGLELGRAIAAVAEARQHGVEVAQEVHVHGGNRRQSPPE